MSFLKSALPLYVASGLGFLVTAGCANPAPVNSPSASTIVTDNTHSMSQILGSSDSSTLNTRNFEPIEQLKKPTKYSLKKETNLLLKTINEANDAVIERYIKNFNPYYIVYDAVPVLQVESNAAADATQPVDEMKAPNTEFSQTNLIEKDVDEADFVKQNAQYIFLYGNFLYGNKSNNTEFTDTKNEANTEENTEENTDKYNALRIYDKSKLAQNAITSKPLSENAGNNSLSNNPVSSISFPAHTYFEGLFLTANKLYTLNLPNIDQSNSYQRRSLIDHSSEPVRIYSYNITDIKSPKLTDAYELEGVYKQARKVKDTLFVVTQSTMNLAKSINCDNHLSQNNRFEKWKQNPDDSIAQCQAQNRITEEELLKHMPKDVNGSPINPDDCYIPPFKEGYHSFLLSDIHLTLIHKIDLSGNNQQTTCVVSDTNGFYMSDKSIYFAKADVDPSNYNETFNNEFIEIADTTTSTTPSLPIQKSTIHKFGIKGNSLTYAGSGQVEGIINLDVPSFSMNEYKGVLRVATTAQTQDGQNSIINMLHTLKESDDRLELVKLATLPNQDNPQSIGKPQERIKGVRFMGDQGYIVTFKNADPLYKIDLSDAYHPKMVGKLDMPGYSAYLHRINDHYLMGIGYTVNERAQPNGIQTTLFDVTGEPKIVAQDTVPIKEDEFQPDFKLLVDTDNKALSTVFDKGVFKVTIPYIQTLDDPLYQDEQPHYSIQTKALEYEVNPNTAEFLHRYRRDGQKMPANMYQQPRFRALIDGNDVFYTTDDGQINVYQWGKP